MTIFVTMNDRFMSGWGKAKGKINKFVVECTTREQADQIIAAASRRNEMNYISMTTKLPYYNPSKYVVSICKFGDLGEIWTGGVAKV